MAETISRIAIHASMDTSGLAADSARASRIISGFGSNVQSGAMYGMVKAAKDVKQAIGAANGNALDLVKTIAAIGTTSPVVAGVLAAAFAAIGTAMMLYRESEKRATAQALLDHELEKKALIDKGGLLADLKRGLEDLGDAQEQAAKKGSLLSQSWEEAKTHLLGMWQGSAAGQSIAASKEFWGAQLQGALAAAKAIRAANYPGMQTASEIDEQTAKVKRENERRLKAIEEAEKSAAKEAEKRQRETEQRMERMKSAAESLRKSVRTPWDVMMDGINDAKELLLEGMIDLETYGRAIDKLATDYMKATNAKTKLAQPIRVGAEIAGTSSAYSAVAESRNAARVWQQQLEEQRKQKAVLEQIHLAVKENKPLTPQVARF